MHNQTKKLLMGKHRLANNLEFKWEIVTILYDQANETIIWLNMHVTEKLFSKPGVPHHRIYRIHSSNKQLNLGDLSSEYL